MVVSWQLLKERGMDGWAQAQLQPRIGNAKSKVL